MISMDRDTLTLHAKYPKMIDQHFELETGPGWFTIIDQTTAEIYDTVAQRRKQRALVLRYNRALARALAGDVAGLEYYFREHYFGHLKPTPDMLDRKVTQALVEAEYEPVPDPYVYPHLVQVKEKFGDLRYYVDNLADELYPLVDLAERLCRYTCEECGTPGHKRENLGWVRVLCDHHYEIAENNFKARQQEYIKQHRAKETA